MQRNFNTITQSASSFSTPLEYSMISENTFHVQCEREIKEIQVINSIGQKVYQENYNNSKNAILSLHKIAVNKGIYIVLVTKEDGTISCKKLKL
ncbi:MAG: T9SS type A sorting domain-containing protein [Bacteroidales bacterium]|nr:T9SS type A sorting domain-containing protein [Bacteroidales bacterium]